MTEGENPAPPSGRVSQWQRTVAVGFVAELEAADFRVKDTHTDPALLIDLLFLLFFESHPGT